ncbi:MAG: NAD(+)/NADH kinase [Candidatus Peregrinibacteria bacterium]
MQHITVSTRTVLQNPEYLQMLLQELKKWNKEIYLSPNAVGNLPPEEAKKYKKMKNLEETDLLIVLGGDGTILSKIQKLQQFSTPIFGINGGHIGFLSSVVPENIPTAIASIFTEKYRRDERMLLSGKITRITGEIETFHALNECTLHHTGVARLREIDTHINEEHLTTYRADGLIIATPTGSTAYNISAGGPIVVPNLDAFILTPLAPSGFAQRSIIIPPEKKITLQICGKSSEMRLSIDGQTSFEISGDDILEITKHPKKATFLRLLEENFYASLREKLGWGL